MSESKNIYDLLNSLEESFEGIFEIIKAMSNENRLKILVALLKGEKNFNDLKEETELKKSALSNHLNQLISAALIEKPDYNKYILSTDGELFIRVVEAAYKKSKIWERKQTKVLERRQFSESFVESFFGK